MRLKTQTKEELIFATVLLIELILLFKAIYGLETYCPTGGFECVDYSYRFGPFFWTMITIVIVTIVAGIVLWFWNKKKNKNKIQGGL